MWTVRLPVRECDRSWIRTRGFLCVFSCSLCHPILSACALPPALQLPPPPALAPVENSMVPFSQGKGLCLMLSPGESSEPSLCIVPSEHFFFKTSFSCYEIQHVVGFFLTDKTKKKKKKTRLKIIHDPSTAAKIQFRFLPLAGVLCEHMCDF